MIHTEFHLHTELSNGNFIDSCTSYEKYVNKAVSLGMKAIAFSEHGNIFSWVKKKQYCDKMGIKYIHGVEAYLTEDIEEKVRDNYHVGLYARNWEGVKELNKMMSIAYNRTDGHYYHAPRITFEELSNTSDNIIVTTACLGGVLSKGCDKPIYDKMIKFLAENKHRCFLEVQHHNVDEQGAYNRKLVKLSLRYDIPLIAGTDTHALDEEHQEARLVLQKAKGIHFNDEDTWEVVFKTTDELINAFTKQGFLTQLEILTAVSNTNVLADMVEHFELDRSNKYPKLYDNTEDVFKEKIEEGWIKRGMNSFSKEKREEYQERIRTEYEVFKKTGSIDYLLFQEKVCDYGHENDMWQGYGRGSVTGSLIAYILGITEMDSIKYKLSFFRFMNPSRISLCDIDVDWYEKDRDAIKIFLFEQEGLYSSEIITFNTIALKGAIKDVARAMNNESEEKIDADYITKNIEAKEDEFRGEYPELFRLVDILNGTVVSIGTHPSGVLISPIPIDENLGTCTLSNCENPVAIVNMKEIDGLNFVKLDVLGLDNMGVINKTCKIAGIERLTPDNIDFNDWNVWKSIRENTVGVFQWESDSAQDYIRRLFSDETIEIIRSVLPDIDYLALFSLGNGLIRPSGASIRYDACKGIFKDNGLVEINEFMADTLGYCVYQEQIMKFLTIFCGYSETESDNVRRGIAKKEGTERLLPEIEERFIAYSTKAFGISHEKAEEVIKPFLQIVLDASSYGFSENHSQPYSGIGYACGWLRYYYPLEFMTSAFNVWRDDKEKIARLTAYAHEQNIKILPIQFRFSRAEYFFNKETSTIYKGLESIKYLNTSIAEKLFELRDKEYQTFTELLVDAVEKAGCGKKQLSILIMLDYFKEFGNSKKLLKVLLMFDSRYKKTHVDATKVKRLVEIVQCEMELENESFTPDEKIKTELSFLGYVETTIPDIAETYVMVTDIVCKYKNPMVTLYQLKSGNTQVIKVLADMYYENKFVIGDILNIISIKEQNKWKKTSDGFKMVDEKEKILRIYNVVK